MVINLIDIWINLSIIFFDRSIITLSSPVLYLEGSIENGRTITAATTEINLAQIAVNVRRPKPFLDVIESWNLLVEYLSLVKNYVVYKKWISAWKIDFWHSNTELLYHLGVIKLILKGATAFLILNILHVWSPSLLSATFSIWSKVQHFSTAFLLLWKLLSVLNYISIHRPNFAVKNPPQVTLECPL